MTVDELRAKLAPHRDELAALGVRSLSVFGSTARGEARAESDVDLLVDLDPELGLLEFVGVKLYLQDLLKRSVDLVEADALRPEMRAEVLREALRAA